MSASARRVLVGAGLLSAVFVLMLSSVLLAPKGATLAAWWPAAGVSVGTVLLAGRARRIPALVALGLVAFAANLLGARPVPVAAGFALANVAECLVAVLLLTRFGGPGRRLHSTADLARLFVAAVSGAVVAGVLATATAALSGHGDLLVTWRAFVASHLAALLVVLPLFFDTPRHRRLPTSEFVIQWTGLLAVVTVVFGVAHGLPLAFITLPLLVWGALRQSVRTTLLQLLALGVIVSTFTARGAGPLAVDSSGSTLEPETISALVQAFLAVCAITVLPLAVTVQQRRDLLEDVRQREELFRHGFADALLGMVLLRPEGRRARVVERNAVAARLLGDRAPASESADWCEHFAEPGRSAVRAALATLGRTEPAATGWRGEVRLADSDRWVEVVLSPLARGDAEPMVTAQLVDTTEQHRAREVLTAALVTERTLVTELQRLHEAKGTFVSSVSHELRTPVTNVVGYIEMLLDEVVGPLNADQRDMLERVRRNGGRLMVLVEDLLVASRLDSGAAAPRLVDLDLRDCPDGALEAVGPALLSRTLHIEVDLGPTPLPVAADPEQMERLVINLLSNAIKFTPDGGRITVRTMLRDGHAVLEVEDTGMGIPDEEQGQLFSKFFRSSTAQRDAIQGTGIGLSIVKAIADQHRGTLTARSRIGYGSTFTLRLPLAGDVASPATPSSGTTSVSTTVPAG